MRYVFINIISQWSYNAAEPSSPMTAESHATDLVTVVHRNHVCPVSVQPSDVHNTVFGELGFTKYFNKSSDDV